MAKRPGAATVTGGAALLFLLTPGVATARDAGFPAEVSGGYASWSTAGTGLDLGAGAPASPGGTGRAWFPATGGGADPGTADASIDLGGTAELGSADEPLTLTGLHLDLDGSTGTLRSGALALAELTGAAAPAVRTGGVTWSGLRASLTADGAALLARWSGQEYAPGDALGVLDVTVGTGGAAEAPQPSPSPTPAPTPTPTPEAEAAATPTPVPRKPIASVAHAALAPGSRQRVTGEGFTPGEVVLVAVDADTRYQAVADEQGRVEREFPVYETAATGEHTVELYTVTSGSTGLEDKRVEARFAIR
ncbi:hypothetical protein ACIPSE_15315 [Streptomyces sp. NPDC090106]|uniref:hypothetical protein n=1 Tax=Streptomyces sp. NPDC090106 TaxID=3365946 RepID=UPI0037FDF4C7